MKYLQNPFNGAPIRDVWYESVLYFEEKEGETFKPGDVIKIEDELADFVLSLFHFVNEITLERARKVEEEKKTMKFKCQDCDFVTTTQLSLTAHEASHKRKQKIDDALGIKVIQKRAKGLTQGEEEIDRQKDIDAEGAEDGLEGEGLVHETLKI